MNIKLVIKRLFHCFRLFVDIKRLYFDNIEIVPIFLKTQKKLYRNQIEIFGIILRSTNFISNRIESNRNRIVSNQFSVPIFQNRPCLVPI